MFTQSAMRIATDTSSKTITIDASQPLSVFSMVNGSVLDQSRVDFRL